MGATQEESSLEDRRDATAGEPRGGTITVLVKALTNGYHTTISLASRKKPAHDQSIACARRRASGANAQCPMVVSGQSQSPRGGWQRRYASRWREMEVPTRSDSAWRLIAMMAAEARTLPRCPPYSSMHPVKETLEHAWAKCVHRT